MAETEIATLDEAARARIEHMVSEVDGLCAHAREQGASMARWLLASLLAVNGGAAIALLGMENPPQGALHAPLLAFVAGIVVALMTGICSYYEAEFAEQGASELADSTRDQLAGFETKDDKFHKLMGKAKIARRATLLLAPASLLAFVAGAWLAHPLIN